MFKVTIDETNIIIHIISQKYGIDLSGSAMASLRIKISRYCKKHHLHSPQSLITRLLDQPDMIESFIQDISASSPDMFRDPELWITLRDQILPELLADSDNLRILIPDAVSGEEVISMAILLREAGLDKQAWLTTTCRHNNKNQIENAALSKSRYKTCRDNYKIFNPDSNLNKYFEQRGGKYNLKSGLLSTVKIIVQPEDEVIKSIHAKLILYRNRMIYRNQETAQQVLNRVLDHADTGCIFIIGIKESVKLLGIEERVNVISSDLNIYSKAG